MGKSLRNPSWNFVYFWQFLLELSTHRARKCQWYWVTPSGCHRRVLLLLNLISVWSLERPNLQFNWKLQWLSWTKKLMVNSVHRPLEHPFIHVSKVFVTQNSIWSIHKWYTLVIRSYDTRLRCKSLFIDTNHQNSTPWKTTATNVGSVGHQTFSL